MINKDELNKKKYFQNSLSLRRFFGLFASLAYFKRIPVNIYLVPVQKFLT